MSWTPSEDEIVRKAVAKYGTNQWNRVASLLRRHTAADVRQRWVDVLDPQLVSAAWTSAEDAELRRLQALMPNMWRSIASSLGRSAEETVQRAEFLDGHQSGEVAKNAEPSQASNENEKPTELGSILDHQEERTAAEEASERTAAEARLSTTMGRKATRKQRERRENDEKFAAAVLEHRKIGKKLSTSRISRPEIAAPYAGPNEHSHVAPVKHHVKTRVKRAKLVLPPVEVEKPPPPGPSPAEMQKKLDDLPK